jgi:4-methoxybenzoate monooxygenase (O-demethylating)
LDGQLAFGSGIHTCLGRNIAKLKAKTLVTALASRILAMVLVDKPVFEPVNMLRAYRSILLKVKAA